jgi:hypothetical protein
MMKGRAALCLALGALLGPAAWAHGPSAGGPDDPEASARPLVFDARLADASKRPDERPSPWVVRTASSGPRAAPAQAGIKRQPAGAQGAVPRASNDPHAHHGAH